MSPSSKKRNNVINPFTGKKLGKNFSLISKEEQLRIRELANLPEAIEKRKRTMRTNAHSQGSKNSQFGTMWITNEQENRKIKKTDPIPEGWRKGRSMIHQTREVTE